MDYIEKRGKTVDEAVTEALIELQVASDQVNIEVIQEASKGILGLFGKEAIVRVSKKNDPEQIAKSFLESVFEKMGLVVNIDIKIKDKKLMDIVLSGDNMGVIIGKRGATLDSLQYLVSLVVNKETNDYMRVKLDTEGYRNRRRETLERLAKNLARKVKSSGRKVVLEPMNPYERRIIHSALQSDDKIITYSEGEEPFRRIVIDVK